MKTILILWTLTTFGAGPGERSSIVSIEFDTPRACGIALARVVGESKNRLNGTCVRKDDR